MTITVASDPTTTPPTNTVTVTLPTGAIMTAANIWRTEGSEQHNLRQQPSLGFNSRIVPDYECPYQQNVTYGWTASYLGAPTSLWSETWANLAAWTTVGGGWSVSSGTLVWTGADSAVATVTRAVTTGLYHVVLSSVPVGVATINFGGFSIDVANSRLLVGTNSILFNPGNTTWTIDVTSSAVSITTSAGSYTVTGTAITVTTVQIAGAVHIPVYSTQWTQAAGTVGAFIPYAIAVAASSGNVYVSDDNNQRILKYNSAGVLQGSVGTVGSGTGQFNGLRGIALDSSENVYAVDLTNQNVSKFNSSLVYQSRFSVLGNPNRIALDSAGNIYVTDAANQLVRKYNSAGTAGITWGGSGTGNGQFTAINDIAIDSSNAVYVTDVSAQRVQKFTNLGAYTTQWGSYGTGNSQFGNSSPQGIAVNAAGDIYVVDYANHRVQKFSNTGTYIGQFGVQGTGPGQFTSAFALGADANNVYVSDIGTNYVLKFVAATSVVGPIALSTYGASVTITEQSTPVYLDVANAFLIHPASPALSIAVPISDLTTTQLEALGDGTFASRSVLHDILGQAEPVQVSNSPRRSDSFNMSLTTETAAQRKALEALLADETPILLRVPVSWNVDIDDGFYSVGDVSYTRILQVPGEPERTYTLPLTSVEEPAVAVDGGSWTWADVFSTWGSWAQILLVYKTWADLYVDNRNPGY